MNSYDKFKVKKSNENIFIDMGFTDTEAKELQFRSFLMTVLAKYIKAKGKKVGETAEKFRKKIFRGKIASKIKDTGRLLSGKLKRAFEDEDWNSKVLSYLGR